MKAIWPFELIFVVVSVFFTMAATGFYIPGAEEPRFSFFMEGELIQLRFVVTDIQQGVFDLQVITANDWTQPLLISLEMIAGASWLLALQSGSGEAIFAQLEAVERGYQKLGFVGKHQILQRWARGEEFTAIINYLSGVGGFLTIE